MSISQVRVQDYILASFTVALRFPCPTWSALEDADRGGRADFAVEVVWVG